MWLSYKKMLLVYNSTIIVRELYVYGKSKYGCDKDFY